MTLRSFAARRKVVAGTAVAIAAAASVVASVAPAQAAALTAVKAKTYTGNAVNTKYGPVQVKATIKAGKITKITAIQYPRTDRESAQINSWAIPQLTKAALAAQSPYIDSLSGASWTSYGFATSLQSALTKAGFSKA